MLSTKIRLNLAEMAKEGRHFFSGPPTGKLLMILQITLSRAPLSNSNYAPWSNSNRKKNRSIGNFFGKGKTKVDKT